MALDYPDLDGALGCAEALAPLGARFKVGLELFLRSGPAGVAAVQRVGGPVLLDLKLHDIPRTVGRAVHAVAGLGAWGVTLHATGGPVMLREAVDAAASGTAAGPLRCLAVTVLTSVDEALLRHLGVRASLKDQVQALARMGLASGCDGVVASPHEVEAIREATRPDFLVVTPGVRPAGVARGDQARTATPAAAVRHGADFLVVGRAVTEAADPVAAFTAVAEEVAAASGAGPV